MIERLQAVIIILLYFSNYGLMQGTDITKDKRLPKAEDRPDCIVRTAPTEKELQQILKITRTLVEGEQRVNNLKCSTSDEFLLRFIRASYYKPDASFRLIKNYFKAKLDNPEAFVIQSPARNLKTLLRKDLGLPLKEKDKCGRKILNIKIGKLDPSNENWENIMQSSTMILEAFSMEKDVQEKGVVLILDCVDFSLKIMKWATIPKIRTALGLIQDYIPLRFEEVHIINYPPVFDIFAAALTPFMNPETRRKLIWHKEISTLYYYIDKPRLPVAYGGQLKPEDTEKWYTEVLEKEELFAEIRKMGYMK